MLLEYCIFGVITFLMKGAQCEATEVFAELGSQAVLPCRSSSSSPTPLAIIWSKANKGTVWRKQKSGLQYWGASWSQKGIQRVRCPHSQFERDDYSLQILNVREDDGGIYSCWVDLSGKVFETKVTLRIIKVSVSPSVAMWGSDVSIGCSVTPWPEDAAVQWTLNNSPFVPRTEIPSSRDAASSVVREKATARLNGNWTCVVGYKGREVRASGTLAVKGIIQPATDDTNVYAAVGSVVTLPCVFSPDLIPSNSVWEKLKPGYLLKPSLDRLPASFSPSSPSSQSWDKSASLTEVGFEDQGRYRCSGTVDGQRLTRNMQLVVAKIVSSIPSKKKDSVTLTCQLSDARKITKYEWVHVVHDLKGTRSAGSIQRGKTLSISKVSEENRGEWACRFYGKEGILGNVTHHIQLMSGLSGQKSVSGFSNNTVAMLCLSFLLLVLLLILAQMYKNHQRRKRIFQYPALETIVHTASNEREERERSREKE